MGIDITRFDVTVEDPEATLPESPDHESIAALAHWLWRERGCPEGSPEEDWFRAEQQLRTEKR